MSDITLDKTYLRKFGLTTGALFALLFGLVLPWIFEHSIPTWPWMVAGVLFIWALLLPKTLKPIYKGWMVIGHVLGWINTRIILGTVFYLLIMPIGFIVRTFGRDPMQRKFNDSVTSYRTKAPQKSVEHMDRPY